MKVCKNCGSRFAENDAFCKNCGGPLEEEQASFCPKCGTEIPNGSQFCGGCGTRVNVDPNAENPNIDPQWPLKSKLVAALLAIFLGGFGVHKFYLGKTGMGILYVCFCWTGVPAIIGLIEGIIYLCSSDEKFQIKNQVRIDPDGPKI